jgi:hypothetical protein
MYFSYSSNRRSDVFSSFILKRAYTNVFVKSAVFRNQVISYRSFSYFPEYSIFHRGVTNVDIRLYPFIDITMPHFISKKDLTREHFYLLTNACQILKLYGHRRFRFYNQILKMPVYRFKAQEIKANVSYVYHRTI